MLTSLMIRHTSASMKGIMETLKDIEVEVRGPLSEEKFNSLKEFFDIEGKKIAEKDRVLIDYSTFLEGGIEDRQKDIRLRITNGVPEIIVKLGGWGGSEQRKELSVLTTQGSFDTLVQIFAALGLHKGMLCVRKSQVYEYKGVEFALVEVPGHSYYYEAEKMTHDSENIQACMDEITALCKSLDLDIFTSKDFFEYIHTLNRESNEIFNYTNYIPSYF